MSKLKIQTTQNVELDFELANVGFRILVGVLDIVVIAAYWLCMYYILSALSISSEDSTHIQLLYYLVMFLPTTFYYPLLEFFWKGQTVGKWLLKSRVVKVDGSRLSMSNVLLRWMLRKVDTSLFLLLIVLMGLGLDIDYGVLVFFWIFPFPIIGLITMGVTKNSQRLGDLASGTTVVRLKRQVSLEDTILRVVGDDYKPVFTNVLVLSDRDIRIIKNTLEDFDKTKDYSKVTVLGKKAKELLGIEKDVKPLPMLRTIIRDYNALANK